MCRTVYAETGGQLVGNRFSPLTLHSKGQNGGSQVSVATASACCAILLTTRIVFYVLTVLHALCG